MSKKRKTLPKDFEELLDQGDLSALQAVFERCELDARGGYSKQTALAYAACPDDFSRWLVAQGADLHATDTYGETPLHARAGSLEGRLDVLLALGADVNFGEGTLRGTPLHMAAAIGNAANARTLLDAGARVDALNANRDTPLEHMLRRCRNASIPQVAEVAALLLDRGAQLSDTCTEQIARIGKDFEFHRAAFNPDYLDETVAGLERLYALSGVQAVAPRVMHDGSSPIVVGAGRWEDAYESLWEFLIPSSGAARTVQGEVIRIPGKLGRELHGNGAANWDAAFRRMADAWLAWVASGTPLDADALAEAGAIIDEIKSVQDGDTRRLCELAVQWVARNPTPVALPTPAYDR